MAQPLTRRSFAALLGAARLKAGESATSYWNTQRRGANCFNHTPDSEWLAAARSKSIRLARLAPDKWKPAQRDFLIGDADRYTSIPPADLELLVRFLDAADRHGMGVVLTMLSLPGARWRQLNAGRDDARLWRDLRFRDQSCRFWAQLAAALKGHPAIAGFDLLNEPHPERAFGVDSFRTPELASIQDRMRGTPADLNAFYRALHAAVRSVDEKVPVIFESGLYATPWTLPYLSPVPDPNTLYSFHMYEPYEYTTRRLNRGRLRYPGVMTIEGRESAWNRDALREFLDPVVQWQRLHELNSNRIFAAEFGCSRTVPGVAQYLEDCVSIFEEQAWHWAFYAFREDGWPEMDYELGTGPLGDSYWKAVDSGNKPALKRSDEPLFSIFLKRLVKP